ncbi:MAG: isoprenylcysteine carboxylmethyltransferase family protein [Hyphomicrobiaceae bacterium]|nr:isoprenylcysteine carboxylmethyltransferase family protein [Hyphomicrobiaceae bacterium]
MSPATDDRPSTFPWPPVLLAGAVAVALLLEWLLLPLPVPFAETQPVHFAGMLMVLAGAVLIVWSALEFRRHRTSIRPDRGSDALLLTGPFAFSRNPIYLGDAMLLAGAGITFNKLWLALLVAPFIVLVSKLAIEREEAYLERRFGVAYHDYLSRVRRWL